MFPIASNSDDDKLYVDDVFSTTLYTGNGSTQTITNGIDLAGKGGMVWLKCRNLIQNNMIVDTARGINNNSYALHSNDTSIGSQEFNTAGTSSTGFYISDTGASYNANGNTYASWTFREAAKFFDVVTYTGNGTLLTVNHNLGVAPGMIIVKRLNGVGDWNVYHRSLTASNYYLLLNTTGAQQNGSNTWGAAPTSTTFTVGNASGGDNGVNGSGNTYVAYLFAHDTAADGIIQCGSFTLPASASESVFVDLGWEPQWVLFKTVDSNSNWYIADNMRGFTNNNAVQPALLPSSASAETTAGLANLYSTGFGRNGFGTMQNYIYMAIRRPNKPPTTGTQVFSVSTFGITSGI